MELGHLDHYSINKPLNGTIAGARISACLQTRPHLPGPYLLLECFTLPL